jgi:hypothetical protein
MRGRFRPVTHVNEDMLKKGIEQFLKEPDVDSSRVMVLTELTLSNLRTGDEIDEKDFLDRVDILCSLGHNVLISNYQEYYKLVDYFSNMTKLKIGLILGISNLEYIFDEKYYDSLPGGILQSFATLFSRKVKLFVYPVLDAQTGGIKNCKNFQLPPNLVDLYAYLLVNNKLQDLEDFNPDLLHILSDDVLAAIKAGKPGWEDKVPEEVSRVIKSKALFGYTGHPAESPVENRNVPPV